MQPLAFGQPISSVRWDRFGNTSCGFDPSKKIFIWQSVSLFLDEETVIDSLIAMKDLCIEGSVIAQDFYSTAFLSGEISKPAKKQFDLLEKKGKLAKIGIDMSNDPKATVETFLNDCGLNMTEYIQFGANIRVKPFYCIFETQKR